MSTLIQKFKQLATGGLNRDTSEKFKQLPNIGDFDTEANYIAYADTLTSESNLLIKVYNSKSKRLISSKLNDVISVKDFGALGDGTGDTPNDTGDDIENETWNTWDGTLFKTDTVYSPYWVGGTFNPPRAKPFYNTDTWDFIGISLSLWNLKSTYIPTGDYKINVGSLTAPYPFNGLVIMKGMEAAIFGDGMYKTTITTNEDAGFFITNAATPYTLLTMYKTTAVPTIIRDICFSGPPYYASTSTNLDLIQCLNINGVTWHDLWLTSTYQGIHAYDNSGDSNIHNCTAEFCHSSTVKTDASSEISVDFCNFVASETVTGQMAVSALGRTSITNSRFIGFAGFSVSADNGIFNNNYVSSAAGGLGVQVKFISNCVINGNQFYGASNDTMLAVQNNASITGNYFNNTGVHSIISLGNGTTATNIVITGNTFIKTDLTVAAYNQAIIAPVTGSSYTNAGTQSCIISINTFQGPALTTGLGTATIKANSFDGVYTP